MLAPPHELYPETAQANIVEERMLCRDDCPLFAPGDHAVRPTVATPHPASRSPATGSASTCR